MKTAKLNRSKVVFIVCCIPTLLFAQLNLAIGIDARYRLGDWKVHQAEIHSVELALRKTFADKAGDRFIFFALAGVESNFSHFFIHELYGRLKGQMGVWNLTLGRFNLPFGLLPTFSTSRLLYKTAYPEALGFDVDNGMLFEVRAGLLDYAISITQGYGHAHIPKLDAHGLAVSRIGITLGDEEEIIMGISGALGKTSSPHDRDYALPRSVGVADATFKLNRSTCRAEFYTGKVDGKFFVAGFLNYDFTVLSMVETNLAYTASSYDKRINDVLYLGTTIFIKWFTLRGGYRYAYNSLYRNQVEIQVDYMFSSIL